MCMIYMTPGKRQNYGYGEQSGSCQGLGRSGDVVCEGREHLTLKEDLGLIELIRVLTAVVVTGIYVCMQTHRIVYLEKHELNYM